MLLWAGTTQLAAAPSAKDKVRGIAAADPSGRTLFPPNYLTQKMLPLRMRVIVPPSVLTL